MSKNKTNKFNLGMTNMFHGYLPSPVTKSLVTLAIIAALGACSPTTEKPVINAQSSSNTFSPGAPGIDPTWAFAGKTGIGTSYVPYSDANNESESHSKVWFSIAQGVLTETMYGLIHNAQLKELQFIVTGNGFVDTEKQDTISTIDYLHKDELGRPLSLAYKVINTDKDGKYRIEKHIFTDPLHASLMMRVTFTAFEEGITPYLYVNPHMDNSGANDIADVVSQDGDLALIAYTNEAEPSVMTVKSDLPFIKASTGFVGVSDGLTDIKQDGEMNWQYRSTSDPQDQTIGNVALTAQLPGLEKSTDKEMKSLSFNLVLGFGNDPAQSMANADATLTRGYNQVLADYNGEGEAIGWQDYLASLTALPAMSGNTTDEGKLLYASALVLKAQEDKTHTGALIASLSNPWGDTVSAKVGSTGYKAVWPRDFYQCAMAFLAMGDTQTPKVAFEYLEKVQVTKHTPGYTGTPGWFLQKTHVDGEIEWVGVQLDQTAMPIMLGWKLWQAQIFSDAEITHWYQRMLKPAAEFLVTGGEVNLDWNHTHITPLKTQQERWEEQQGYSPSTAAAVISGLVAASDIARVAGDLKGAQRYLDTAKAMKQGLAERVITTKGLLSADGVAMTLADEQQTPPYYLRLSPQGKPNEARTLGDNNGRAGLDQRLILDGGFLELVRYGVVPADDAVIRQTLALMDNTQLDDNLRVKYTFTAKDGSLFPGFRRYGNDGYGEDTETGASYAEKGTNTPHQRGRVWPFFTGERGHYELALAIDNDSLTEKRHRELVDTYVQGMESFANQGLMLPEQVWDSVGDPSRYHYRHGQGTNSATPLAWTHAEYIKLVRSLTDKRVWDHYPVVDDKLKN
ncbi:glucan 1,4-alpha-glucosidase [Shewanella sp. YLB-07]|nr:glucan 1,4-alpha-glucosidase [Shewanella sp. YLB-07]